MKVYHNIINSLELIRLRSKRRATWQRISQGGRLDKAFRFQWGKPWVNHLEMGTHTHRYQYTT